MEFWWCLKRRDAQMCAFGVLWLSCEAPAARSGGAAGVSHDSPRAQTCPAEGGPGERPKNLENTQTTTTPTTKHQQAPTNKHQQAITSNNTRKIGQNTKTPKLAKYGLAKCGQHFETLILANCGLAKVGQIRMAKVGLSRRTTSCQRQPGNVQRPKQCPQGSGGAVPEETPRGDPGDGCNESPSHRSRHCSIGGRRWASLQSSLRRARLQAQVPPVEKRIADCSQFIERAKKRAEAGSAALQKAVEFKRQCDNEVAAAERRLEVLQREVARSDGGPLLPSQPEGPVVKRCRREDFVPHCDEEMQGRHANLRAAVAGGYLQEVARVSQLITTAAQEWQELINRQLVTMPSSVANVVGLMVP